MHKHALASARKHTQTQARARNHAFGRLIEPRSTYEPDILITFGTDINYLEQILINWNRYELLGTDINYSEQIF